MQDYRTGLRFLGCLALIGIFPFVSACGVSIRSSDEASTGASSSQGSSNSSSGNSGGSNNGSGGSSDPADIVTVGALDTSFNSVGYVTHGNAAGGNLNDGSYSVARDSQNRVIAAGYSRNASGNDDLAVWRYKSDGTLDTTFGGTGYVIHHNAAGGNSGDAGSAVMVDGSDKVIVGGYSTNAAGNLDLAVWRFNTDGTLDTTFNSVGYLVVSDSAGAVGADSATSGILDSEGRIVLGGYSQGATTNVDAVIWRVTTSGVLDTTFNGTGFVVFKNLASAGSYTDRFYGVTVDSLDRPIGIGHSRNAAGNDDFLVARATEAGVADTSFSGDGFITLHNIGGGAGHDNGLGGVTDANNDIYALGSSKTSGTVDMVVLKLDDTGVLDTSFGTSGVFLHNNAAGGNGTDGASAARLDSENRLLVVGSSANASANSDMALWCLNSTTGVLDTDFNSVGYLIHNNAAGGSGADSAGSIVIDSLGYLYLAGRSVNASANQDMAIWKIK